jgi:D-glucosaminate PTS system EIIB component
MSAHLFRLDPRLVHSTLINAWLPSVRARELVVIDSEVVADSRQRSILSLSASGLAVQFFGEEDAAAATLLGDLLPRIVLFSSLPGVRRALDAGLAIQALNIGHLPEGPGRDPLLPAVHLGAQDRKVIRDLERRGVEVYVQPLPKDPKLTVAELERRRAVAPRAPSPTEPVAQVSFFSADGQRSTAARAISRIRRAQARLRVINERGLHLRAAHAFAQLAASLEENVQVANGPDFVNAKSLLGLTTLGATCGTELDVVITGPAPDEAMEQVRALFADGFGEGTQKRGRAEDEG